MNTRFGDLSCAARAQHIPVGPAPMTRTSLPSSISAIFAAHHPVARMSPASTAPVSLTPSGMTVRPVSACGTRTYSACMPSMRQPIAQPPSGRMQLFTLPRPQKKHSPQKVSTFTDTRSPGRTFFTARPTFSTTPTASCPTVTPTSARGTKPCRMCRSLVHMLASVTRTMASVSSAITGNGFSTSPNFPLLR